MFGCVGGVGASTARLWCTSVTVLPTQFNALSRDASLRLSSIALLVCGLLGPFRCTGQVRYESQAILGEWVMAVYYTQVLGAYRRVLNDAPHKSGVSH